MQELQQRRLIGSEPLERLALDAGEPPSSEEGGEWGDGNERAGAEG
jgi:hypothetical protein